MRSLRACSNSFALTLGSLRHLSSSSSSSSSSPSSRIDISQLRRELPARQLPLSHDYLTPQPSHLLNLSLPETLRSTHCKNSSDYNGVDRKKLPSITRPSCMPPGHHLVYFPPQVTISDLLPDGTDVLHTPGPPFNRRVWAGGRITFPGPNDHAKNLRFDGQRAVCVEKIDNVDVRGSEGDEKIFVTIDRRFTLVNENEDEAQIRARVAENDRELIVEKRTLCFIPDHTESANQPDALAPVRRRIPAPAHADISHTFTPTKALLFRFSALTFNAHLIHLDPLYAQNVEGHLNILVHGPLTVVLMLGLLSKHLSKQGLFIKEFEYRNLAPLHVDEEMRICAKAKQQDSASSTSWAVWIEGPQRGLAVRGTAWTAPVAA